MNGEMDFMILNNKVKGVQGTVDNIDTNVSAVKSNTDTNNTASKTGTLSQKLSYIIENSESASDSSDTSDATAVTLALLSDDERQNEWAFRQHGLGMVLNDIFELNSPELIACDTVYDIAANHSIVLMLKLNATAWYTCSRSVVLASAMASIDPETILANGLSGQFYNVGDIVNLTWNGVATPFRVVHKDYYTQGKIILMSENILTTSKYHDSANNYSVSTLRSLLNGSSILGKFSAAIQNAMTSPAVCCHHKATEIICNDKIFAPSYAEVGLGQHQYVPVEGTVWSYFSGGQSRIKNNNGVATVWWLRTPTTNSDNLVWNVRADGTANGNSVANAYGVVPCFEI